MRKRSSRPAHRLPRLCFHRGTGLFYVTLNSREVYLGNARRAAKREYDRIVAEWLANGRSLRHAGHDGTIAELLNAYRKHAEQHYRGPDGEPTGQMGLVSLAIRRLRLMYGDMLAGEFGPLKLQALRGQLVDEKLARNYVNSTVSRIRAIFRWGVAQELVPASVYQALAAVEGLKAGRSAARETAPVEAIDDATFLATLKYLPPTVADMARIERLTGCRPGEVCGMRPGDIDRSRAVWVYSPPRHKNAWRGKERRIYIGADAQAILAPYLLRAAEAYCFSPAASERGRNAAKRVTRQTPMTPSQAKRKPKRDRKRAPRDRYTTRSYSRAIRRAARLAGVERWSANRLRHAAAKEIQEQFGLEHAAAVLGNTVPVAARYAGFNYRLAEEVMAERSLGTNSQSATADNAG